jgi:hypothetical protein
MGEPTGSISVVVPVYNGERSLDELIRRLEPVLEGETVRYEVILVDDDSRSTTTAATGAGSASGSWPGPGPGCTACA